MESVAGKTEEEIGERPEASFRQAIVSRWGDEAGRGMVKSKETIEEEVT